MQVERKIRDNDLLSGQGILQPTEELQSLVKYIWYFSGSFMKRPSSSFRIIPSGSTGLIFHHYNGRPSVKILNGSYYPIAFVHGQDSKPVINVDTENSTLVSFRFYPTTIKKLFRINTNELTDQVIPLNDLAGYNLTEQLLNAISLFQAIQLISDFLIKKAREEIKSDLIVEDGLRIIQKNISSITPAFVQNNFDISERQFQRRFLAQVGINCETYIRILKFQASINMIQNGYFDKLSDIAYDLGYSDQPHFIREFKNLSGLTPNEAFKHLTKPDFTNPSILPRHFKITRFLYEK